MTDASSKAADIITEAQRIVAAANEQGVTLRLLGGIAIRLHSSHAIHHALVREYGDIDLMAAPRQGRAVEKLLSDLDYTPDKSFNLLQGDSRLLFHDQEYDRQVDVFVGSFEMCHRLPLDERLSIEPLTVPLAELLLTKLQIVEINPKDLRDVVALLIDHPLGNSDEETINVQRITELCARDWGLWKTVTLNLDKLRSFVPGLDLPDDAKHTLYRRIDELSKALDVTPKSLKWKTRAAIGERLRWYELPEEVRRG